MKRLKQKLALATVIVAVLLSLICIIPMALNPNWNGKRENHTNQYELMGESLLNGRLDLAIEVDPKLAAMENPYDPAEREKQGVEFAWDHAYYKGKYYMYFGVVPAALLFAPFQAVTGHRLPTFIATQLFVVIVIAGIFSLFWLLRKTYFKKMKYSTYLILSVTICIMSVWYSVGAPSLYCTAITAAIACEVWSIYLFFKALEKNKNGLRFWPWLLGGCLLGALAFGCRPTIALTNIVLIPVLWKVFKHESHITLKFVLKIALSLMPYLLVGVLLMLYNYARFESFTEFGQSYQLTISDQTSYASGSLNLANVFGGIGEMFFRFNGFSSKAPFLQFMGVVWEFPLLLLAIIGLFKRSVRENLGELKPFLYALILATIIITISVVAWSPLILERYHMDINFILGIICFIVLGAWKGLSRKTIAAFCILTILMCAWLFLVPCDHNIGEFLFR